jgi:hypothetical protein
MCSARRKPLKMAREAPKMPENLPRIVMPNFALLASTASYLLPLPSTLDHILCRFCRMSIAKIHFFSK